MAGLLALLLTPATCLAAPEPSPRLASAAPLAIRQVVADRATVPRYERLELQVDLAGTWDNPFDPDQIDLTARFTSPSGRTMAVPGFLYRAGTRARSGAREMVSLQGAPEWRVRFAPTAEGEWRYQVTARDRSGTVTSPAGTFRCRPGQRPGYVRVSRDDPHYFAFDDGSPYFALGANVCWPGQAGTYDYDTWFDRYRQAGGNYARLWLGPFDCFTFERQAEAGREDTGLGRYDLANAWRLDYVVELAERQGIYLMLCAESFNSLRSRPPYHLWASNPYNQAVGGLLAQPGEFFTNAAAQRLFRNRLRYLLARYGYSTHVLSWEYWNEVDIIDKYVSAEAKAWHQSMSRYLRDLDPWQHLQTTSYAGSAGDAAVDGLPEMDYVQTHNYGARDTAATLANWSQTKRRFGKPHYVGEFGLDAGGAGSDRDPHGVSLHDGLWTSVLSGDAGAAMLWWWDSYIHPRNLYYHFQAVAAYTRGIDWPRRQLQPAACDTVFATRPSAPAKQDLVLTGGPVSWSASPANQPCTIKLPRTGRPAGLERLSGIQHGLRNHPALHNPATFEVDYAAAGQFQVVVRGVSGHGGAALKVTLDGQVVLTKEFTDPDGMSKTADLRQYDGKYAIDVAAGPHTIQVENTGADWFYVDYLLPGYAEVWSPRLRSLSLVGNRLALAWVQHLDHTWSRLADGAKPEPVTGAVLRLPGVADGTWQVELWDTTKGEVTARLPVAASAGTLAVPLPPVASDLALKATR